MRPENRITPRAQDNLSSKLAWVQLVLFFAGLGTLLFAFAAEEPGLALIGLAFVILVVFIKIFDRARLHLPADWSISYNTANKILVLLLGFGILFAWVGGIIILESIAVVVLALLPGFLSIIVAGRLRKAGRLRA